MKTLKLLLVIALAVILPLSVSAKQYGPFLYSGSVDQRDTLTIAELYYWLGGESAVGKYIWCQSTTDLAAPMNEACYIEKHTITSGLIIADTASSASIGFSADVNDGDVLWVMDETPAGALLRFALTATKVASGVPTLNYMLYLTNLCDSTLGALTSNVGNQWGTAAAPANGVAFDEALLYTIQKSDSIYNWLNSATGLNSWGTAAAPAAGVNFAEALLYRSQKDDSLYNWLNSATGLNAWPTGLFPAAGVSFAEVIEFIADSLRALKVAIDSMNSIKAEYAEDMLEWGSQPPGSAGNLVVIVDYSSASWNTVAIHKVIDFPANVEVEFWLEIYDSTELVCTGATDSTFFEFGSGLRVVDVLTGTAGAAAEFDPGERIGWPVPRIWAATGGTLTKQNPTNAGVVELAADGIADNSIFHGLSKGVDLGYELQGIGTSGIMVWVCRWRCVRGSGAVTAATGSAF